MSGGNGTERASGQVCRGGQSDEGTKRQFLVVVLGGGEVSRRVLSDGLRANNAEHELSKSA
jgi:hypothetical protein